MIQFISSIFFFFISINILASDKIILTSFYPIHITAMNIVDGISTIKLQSLTKPFVGCLHDYQLSPNEMILLSKAEYLIINGAGMESFIETIAKSQKKLKIIDASNEIPLLKTGKNSPPNPHVWLSIPLAILQVKNITKALSKEMPEFQKQFDHNAQAYISKLEQLDREIKIEMKKRSETSFVSFHEAFPYFAKEYGLKISAVIEREPGTLPSSKEIIEIIKVIKSSSSKVIFTEPQYSNKSAQMIAKESGATVYNLDPIVTGDFSKNAYINAMRENLSILKKAFPTK